LALMHFRGDLISELRETVGTPKCPHCNYKQTSPQDLVRHVGKNHRMVDKYLARLVPSLVGPQKLSLGQAKQCPVCSETVDLGEEVAHAVLHFFSCQIVPILGATECPYPGCIIDIDGSKDKQAYGQLCLHVSNKHFKESMERFFNSDMKGWITSVEVEQLFEVNAHNLLSSCLCIICFGQLQNNDYHQHFIDHCQPLAKNAIPDEEPFQCDLCDGFPTFSSVEEARWHHLTDHVKTDLVLGALTSPQAICDLRSKLYVQLNPLNSTELMHDDCSSSSIGHPDTNSQISDDSRPGSPWPDTAGSRPPCGVKSITNWGEESDSQLCEFSGCEGYPEGQYHRHLTKHFRELLHQDITKEKELMGLTSLGPLLCPRCVFSGSSELELLEHYGHYHQVLDYYVQVARDSSTLDRLCAGGSRVELGQGGECGTCGFSSPSVAVMTKHQLGHMKTILSVLPVVQPYICPVCWYEAGTRLGLVRHWADQHGDQISNASMNISDIANTSVRNIEVKDIESDDEESDIENLTMVRVAATYSKPMLKSLNTSSKQSSSDLSIKENHLKSFLNSLFNFDIKTEEGEVEDHSMETQMKRWTTECGVKTGVTNDFPSPRGTKEPGLGTLSPRHILTIQESSLLSPQCRHSWLCDGRLLHLYDAVSPGNMALFQYQWARGQPVLVSNSDEHMNQNLWHPRAFSKDFGHLRSDIVNTLTGKTLPKIPLKWFWDGFENVSLRLLDSGGNPMLLKLKDWPPDGDIAEYIPKRFHDLVHDFPIQSYTLREGHHNLASNIPDYFLRPELGPKMYIAYGNALYNNKASTNLHLDMSDAVNLLVYVGIPDDCDKQENIKLVLSQIDEAGCDLLMKRKVRDEGRMPGALWHIYHPGDTNKIRDLLSKVAIENRRRLDPHDDPIHDQSTYLDAKLRRRLYDEYGVKGYAIIQCSGDTVFIPVGACHQVRNLHNCIKIAEDFVSPELANNCLHLTQEFRHLTEHHTNHEDKLQIKNIIYHSVKTAVSKLKKKMEEEQAQQNGSSDH